MRKLHTRKGGFTLIELMIVVAIIGILAAIAIPNFLRFQLRSRVGEGKTNIAGIRTAEEAYFAEYNTYVGAGQQPAVLPGNNKTDWPTPALGFDTIGWFPEGEVYYQYQVSYASATPTLYTVHGTSDIDGNGANNEWGYVHAPPGVTVGIALGTCAATGVYNGVTMMQDLMNTTGPCTAADGQSLF
jgi:type IV pilus assembly protein PilA